MYIINVTFVILWLRFYLEVKVEQNADNVSLAIVDFDDGGHSSVTFSPDTGMILRTTNVSP